MTKVHSTTTPYNHKPKKARKPKKPHKNFPLTPHPSGNWCKKVNGRIYYFGHHADEALLRWLAEKDDLLAGRTPAARGRQRRRVPAVPVAGAATGPGCAGRNRRQ